MAGSAVIGSLRVLLGLDSATFDTGLEQSRAKARAGAADIGKALDSIFDSSRLRLFEEGGAKLQVFGSALEHLGGVGIAAGVGLGALAIGFEEVKKSLEFADKIEDAAKAASLSTTALQEYRFAVHDLGGQYQDADKAITDFTVKFNLAAAGFSKRATKPFEALGLDAKSLGDTETGLKATIDAIHNLSSAGAQAAAADKVGLTPMLAAIRAGAPAIDELRQAAHALGYVMDEDLIGKAAEANKHFQDLSAVVGVQFRSAFVELAPAILAVTQGVADLAAAFNKLFSGFADGAHQQALNTIAQIAKDFSTGHPLQILLDSGQQQARYLDAQQNGGFIKNLYSPVQGVPNAPAPPGTGTFTVNPTPKNGNAERNASAAAIDAATKEELAAQKALTGNIEELRDLSIAEVDQETKAKTDKLAREASEKKITQAAAGRATLLTDLADVEKVGKIQRDAQFALDKQALDQADQINGYYNEIDNITAAMAGTAAERAKAETGALHFQQKSQRDHEELTLAQQVADGQRTESYRQEALAALADLQTAQRAQLAERQRVDAVQEAARHEQAALQLQVDLLSAQADLSKSTYARNVAAEAILAIEQKIETSKAQEALSVAQITGVDIKEAEDRLAALPQIQEARAKQLAAQTRLIDAVAEAGTEASDMALAFKDHNWAKVFDDFEKTIQTVQAAFANDGPVGGTLAAASAIGNAIGGTAGKTISDAASAGSVALQVTGNPIIAAAAAAVAAIVDLAKGKPSNNGAIATFNGSTFSLSGDKRNASTNTVATTAANAIEQGEQLLAAAGVTLTTTIKSIDIGTRDATHILLSNGQTLSSGVADAAAAADTTLKALLQGATFASDAQKSLVDSMLAAGRGFDDISAALQNFNAAQTLTNTFGAALQQLTDPKGYDLAQLKVTQDARAAQVNAAAAAGYLTADQLATINDQLKRLSALEIDQVVQKYAAALTSAAQTAADAATKAADAVTTSARQALSAAVQAQATVLQQTAQQFGALSTSLTAYLATLNSSGQAGGAGYAALSSQFNSTAAAAALGDLTAGGNLQGIATAFDAASLAHAHSEQEYLADQAKIKAGIAAAADTATRQASIAQQQLAELHSQTDVLLNINSSVLSVADAITQLNAAIEAEAAAGPAAYAAAMAAASAGPTVSTDTSAITPATTTVDATALVPANDTSATIAQAVSDQLKPALDVIAKSTGDFADFADQWTNGQIPLSVQIV